MTAKNPDIVSKVSPERCPNCGEKHEVKVDRSDELVDLLRLDDSVWAEKYPIWEGYRFYYKKCSTGTPQELRVVAKDSTVSV